VTLLNRLTRRLDGHFTELLAVSTSAFVLRLCGLLAGYVFTVIVSRLYGAEIWGSFTLATTVVLAGTTLARLGLDTALLRVVAANRDARAGGLRELHVGAVRIVLATSVASAAIVYGLAPILATRVFHGPELEGAFRIAALAIPPLALSSLTAQTLRGLGRVQQSVYLDYVSRWLYPVVILLAIVAVSQTNSAAVISYVAGAYVTAAVASINLHLQFRRLGDRSIEPKTELLPLRQLVLIGLPLLLASSTDLVRGYIDTLMLGLYLSPADVGIYGVALKLSSLTGLSLLAVNSIAAPQFAALHKAQDHQGLVRTVRRSTFLIVGAALPVLLVLVVFARPILGIFGPGFASGRIALHILVAGQCINALSGSVGYLLQMSGFQVAYQNITLGTTILKILLNIVLVPQFGIVGAAIATCLTVVAWNLAGIWYTHRALRISTFFNPFQLGWRSSG
jgi:O-antigen/teichoic acid export membrane protein